MKKIYIECLISGLISLILGSILFDILKDEFDKKIKDKKIDNIIKVCFFFTGILLHIIIEYFGMNRVYCDKGTKKCYKNINCIFGDCDEKN